jgi:hypothetical protein
MSRDEFCAANRRNWDERVAIHRRDTTGFYAVERFLAGEKRLHAIDSGELGEIAGKRLMHLQCHFGLDTLILAREGAVATGLDFSPAAIAELRIRLGYGGSNIRLTRPAGGGLIVVQNRQGALSEDVSDFASLICGRARHGSSRLPQS